VGFGVAEAQGSLPSPSPGKVAAGTDPARKRCTTTLVIAVLLAYQYLNKSR
jgi:hypothetical protein